MGTINFDHDKEIAGRINRSLRRRGLKVDLETEEWIALCMVVAVWLYIPGLFMKLRSLVNGGTPSRKTEFWQNEERGEKKQCLVEEIHF